TITSESRQPSPNSLRSSKHLARCQYRTATADFHFLGGIFGLLREQTPHALGFLDTLDADHQRRKAHGNLLLSVRRQYLRVSHLQGSIQLVHNLGFGPKKALKVLHPFETGDHHTSRVAQNVRNNENLRPLVENLLRFRRRRAISALSQHPALQF